MQSNARRLFATLLGLSRNAKFRGMSDFAIKGVHVPEYLDLLKPQIPFYKLLNIQIKSHDMAVLESYGSYVHRLSNRLGLKVNKYWCAPHTSSRFENLSPESYAISTASELKLYERNVQISNISGRLTSLLVEVIHRTLPADVQLSIHEHNHELHEKTRYISDFELLQYERDYKQLVASRADEEEEPVKKK